MNKVSSVKMNALLNIIKQCCNILFPIITYPYVSRIVGAASLGRYSFADSIIQYALILSSLGAAGYAIREGARIRDNKMKITEFSSEIFTINLISLAISTIILCFLLFASERVSRERLLISILSINVFANIFGRDWINSIYEDYLYITLRYIIFQILAMIAMLTFIRSPEDVTKYAVIVVFGNAGAQFTNIIHTCKVVPLRIKFSKDLLKHLKPILYMFCISVASVIYINSDITILGYFKSDEDVGIYYMVGKVYTIVKALINAVIMVTIPRLSYYVGNHDKEKYQQLLSSLRDYLYTLIIPVTVGMFMLSGNILKIIGGNEFASGIQALRILSIAMLFAVFACFYAQSILIPNRKEKIFFFATVTSAVVNIGLNLVIIPYLGVNGAALTTLISEIIVVIVCATNSKGLHNKFETKGIIVIMIGAATIVAICYIVNCIFSNFIISTSLSIILAFISYFLVLLIGKNKIVLSLTSRKMHFFR